MEDRQLDKIREKLYDMKMPVDDGIWDNIEVSLRRRKLRKVFLYASSVAAAVLVALLLAVPDPQESHIPSQIAEVVPDTATAGQKTYDFYRQVPSAVEEPVHSGNPDVAAVPEDRVQSIAVPDTLERENTRTIPKTPASETDKVAEESVAAKGHDRPEKREDLLQFNLEYSEGDVTGVSSRKRRGYSVAFLSGVMPASAANMPNSSIKASSAGAGAVSGSYIVEQVSDTKYSLPLNLGVQFQFPVGENMALGIGVNYTMLRSRFDCLLNKQKYNVRQTLHYIGVPVNVYGVIAQRNRFNFYVNAGAMLEKGIRMGYRLRSYNNTIRTSSSVDGVEFSINAGLGVEYMAGSVVGIYFEPNLVYFVNSDMPYSIRTDQPLQVKAEAGLRFHF